jgi:hypothetical protein
MFVGLIGLIIFIIDIYAIFLIITGSGSLAIKVVWMLVVLLLPLLGPILYFLLGRGTAA